MMMIAMATVVGGADDQKNAMTFPPMMSADGRASPIPLARPTRGAVILARKKFAQLRIVTRKI